MIGLTIEQLRFVQLLAENGETVYSVEACWDRDGKPIHAEVKCEGMTYYVSPVGSFDMNRPTFAG